jgi:SAM-dependent methyltransferase
MTSFDKDFWEQRWQQVYREHDDPAQDRPPNITLTEAIADVDPGAALDAGCGNGPDALWLAARGWRVTAVDASPTVLAHARSAADAIEPAVAQRIDWVDADLTFWTPPVGHYDLVTSHYVHTGAPVAELVRRLASAVAPAGTLLIVGHHPSDPTIAAASSVLFTSEDIIEALEPSNWQIDLAEVRSRAALDAHGAATTAYDTVVRARRAA